MGNKTLNFADKLKLKIQSRGGGKNFDTAAASEITNPNPFSKNHQ
jgi:hypothetical protein